MVKFAVAATIATAGIGFNVNAQETPTVTSNNYVRAETDFQMTGYIAAMDIFGRFLHVREPYDVKNQVTVRGNRDTLYSWGVFDLASPLTISLPDTGDRYQSLMVVSQDHSISVKYGPGDVVLSEKSVGTRYATLVIRTFADPNSEEDMQAAFKAQDGVSIQQDNIGEFSVPQWDKDQVEAMREHFAVVASTVPDSSRFFGDINELDPVYHKLGTALGWGGLPAKAAFYGIVFPEQNDGETPYTLTVKDVPVDGFWSVTLYDKDGWMPVNKYDAYSFNNVTADKNDDGSITIHFGGNPEQSNFLPINEGWNYIVRQYRPKEAILDGSWTFPAPVAVK
ncbi:MAG: DUF1214 domain-containing protein [Planctomycetia bacterium]|nr:DUF1214 domain-containing protein [Planctomycetia bacterium]